MALNIWKTITVKNCCSYIPRRPQKFDKNFILNLQGNDKKTLGDFAKLLWPSQNIWTLKNIKNTWVSTK